MKRVIFLIHTQNPNTLNFMPNNAAEQDSTPISLIMCLLIHECIVSKLPLPTMQSFCCWALLPHQVGSYKLPTQNPCLIRQGSVPSETRGFQWAHTCLVDHHLKRGLKTSEFLECLTPEIGEMSMSILRGAKRMTL